MDSLSKVVSSAYAQPAIGYYKYSRVHISSDKAFFQDSEETIHSAEINATSYERQNAWNFFLSNLQPQVGVRAWFLVSYNIILF